MDVLDAAADGEAVGELARGVEADEQVAAGERCAGAAITAALKSRIANFKVPKAVFVVGDLPRNAMGKVQKNLLREQHKALFTG